MAQGFKKIVFIGTEELHSCPSVIAIKVSFHSNLSDKSAIVVSSFDVGVEISNCLIVSKTPHGVIIVACFDIIPSIVVYVICN
jgi:hypothetical protein